MKEIFLVVGREMEVDANGNHQYFNDREPDIQTAWLDPDNAKQQRYKSNSEQSLIGFEVESVMIQDSISLPYIMIIMSEGVIDPPVLGTNLEDLIQEMNETLYNNFSHRSDNARIFNAQGKEVHVFDHKAMYAKVKTDPNLDSDEDEEDGEDEDDDGSSDEMMPSQAKAQVKPSMKGLARKKARQATVLFADTDNEDGDENDEDDEDDEE